MLEAPRRTVTRHTVVVSDLHLWEPVDGDGLWMRYRQRRFFPDDGLHDLFSRLIERCDDGAIELVLNGDIFDLDVSRPDGVVDPPVAERAAVERMRGILSHHERFLDGLALLLAHGHRVIFVAGNHDLAMVMSSVRAVVIEHVGLALDRAGFAGEQRAEALSRVQMQGWFYRTEDGIVVEHGAQYDAYTSVPYALWPVAPKADTMQQTMGSLTMRHLIGRLGYFNPNVDQSFLLSLGGYFWHWVRHYLFTKRSLALRWTLGSVQVGLGLLFGRERKHPTREVVSLVRATQETGCDVRALVAHAALTQPSAMRRAARLLCLDRMALGLCATTALVMLALSRTAGWIALALTALLAVLSRFVLPSGELAENNRTVSAAQRSIARVHGARAVVFGHTHLPEGQWEDGVFFGNCGSWAPMYTDIACTVAVQSALPFVWLRSEGGTLEGGLYRFDGRAMISAESEERSKLSAVREPKPA